MVSVRKTSTKYFEASPDEECPHCGGSLVQLILKQEDNRFNFWYQCHDCAEESDTTEGPEFSSTELNTDTEDCAVKTAEHAVEEHPWTI